MIDGFACLSLSRSSLSKSGFRATKTRLKPREAKVCENWSPIPEVHPVISMYESEER
jgi:hypothetical protein